MDARIRNLVDRPLSLTLPGRQVFIRQGEEGLVPESVAAKWVARKWAARLDPPPVSKPAAPIEDNPPASGKK